MGKIIMINLTYKFDELNIYYFVNLKGLLTKPKNKLKKNHLGSPR